jgi:hypothetical protein
VNPVAAGVDPLLELRAYHLPGPVSWWPPAPGWWLLLALLAMVAAVFAWWFVRRHRGRAAARQAARELAALRSALAANGDHAAFVRGLSRLLRRYARAAFPRQPVAALTGDDWLAFLDAHGGGGRFRNGPGRQLAEAPYRPAAQIAVNELAELVRDWIQCNVEVKP